MSKYRHIERLGRYGIAAHELEILTAALGEFHCSDTCGRRRKCLDRLCVAAGEGDALAIKLLTASHRDRLMDDAALAYGRMLGGNCCERLSHEAGDVRVPPVTVSSARPGASLLSAGSRH